MLLFPSHNLGSEELLTQEPRLLRPADHQAVLLQIYAQQLNLISSDLHCIDQACK